jgi:hypothetical protein
MQTDVAGRDCGHEGASLLIRKPLRRPFSAGEREFCAVAVTAATVYMREDEIVRPGFLERGLVSQEGSVE